MAKIDLAGNSYQIRFHDFDREISKEEAAWLFLFFASGKRDISLRAVLILKPRRDDTI
jgi:hypothetical protein